MSERSAYYEKFFQEADTDNSGSLECSEVLTMLKKKGYPQSDLEIKRMFQTVDISGDGHISRDEFMEAMGEQPPAVHGAAAMRSTFVEFDKDGDGEITKDELKQVLKEVKLCQGIEDKHIERMIELADKDKSGTLDYNEFLAHAFGK